MTYACSGYIAIKQLYNYLYPNFVQHGLYSISSRDLSDLYVIILGNSSFLEYTTLVTYVANPYKVLLTSHTLLHGGLIALIVKCI